ncbi:MAG: hypothetical protein M1816_005254 [Peltula sp. TS41687]|nr:MAG: hypothetical protein M1816_005254 [Peltula sp. TS41687]
MAEEDTIACIYPADGDGFDNASLAIDLPQNTSRYVPRKRPRPVLLQELQYGRREPTMEPEEYDSLEYRACIRVTFSKGPKTRHGFVAGWDPNSDFVLPHISGVSFHHFSMKFDEQCRLIIRDLGSTCGTSVKYGQEDEGRRRHGTWIIGGHEFLDEVSEIVINVNRFLQFRIVVPVHDTRSQVYRAKVDKFREGTMGTEDLFRELDLRQNVPRTRRPTGAHTPSRGSITLKKKLGQGSYAIVYRIWNATTGDHYALKEPEGRYDVDAWKNEALIMGRISHPHIVEFLGAEFEPYHPKLRLEYVPGRSLNDHLMASDRFSRFECVQILRQCLSALEYLHGLEPPVVHRDIGTRNIPVKYRRADTVFVKFADFGLAKEGQHLKTICGNVTFMAPELYAEVQVKPWGARSEEVYTTAVDIWSLDVVIVELLCQLPGWKSEYQSQGVIWCEKILEKVREHFKGTRDGLALFLLGTMLPIDPRSRASAQESHNRARNLSNSTRNNLETRTSDSLEGNDSQQSTTVRLDMEDEDYGHQTVVFRGTHNSGMNTLSSLGSSSLNQYLTGLPNTRRDERLSTSLPGSPETGSTSVALERKAEVKRLVNKMSDPEDPLFLGSGVQGAGENFDFKYGTSHPLEDMHPSVRIDDASDPVIDSEWELVPRETEPLQKGHGAELGTPTGHQGDDTCSDVSARVLNILGNFVRDWSQESTISAETLEPSHEPDAVSDDGLQSRPQPQLGTEAGVKRKRATDNAVAATSLLSQPEAGRGRGGPQGPVGKRTKNASVYSEVRRTRVGKA